MRRLTLLLFLVTQAASYANGYPASDSTGIGERKLLLKIPLIHGGMNASFFGSSTSPIQEKYTFEGMGSGLWYFPLNRFSYQLDADFRFSTGEYQVPSMISDNGCLSMDTTFLGYGYFSPQVSLAINYTLTDLDHFKVYTFVSANLQLMRWTLRKVTVPGEGTPVGGTPYQGTEYAAVYRVHFQNDDLTKNVRIGMAWAGRENLVVARLYTEVSPPAHFSYHAEPISSEPKESKSFPVKSNWGMAFGFSLEFNTTLHSFGY